MTDLQGILCVSVDSHAPNELSIETTHRRREIIELLQRFEIPSNWTLTGNHRVELPTNAETTVGLPKSINRPDLVQHLRVMSAALLRDAATLNSVVIDPHEARNHWDVLVRHGCVVARPRTATVTTDTGPRILRGGLWVAPMSCSFVGGSKRSVRSLFGVCQRKLVEAASRSHPFHLNVDIGNDRDSWREEAEALRALFQTAHDQRRKARIRCVHLGELPSILTKKPSKPMASILRRAS